MTPLARNFKGSCTHDILAVRCFFFKCLNLFEKYIFLYVFSLRACLMFEGYLRSKFFFYREKNVYIPMCVLTLKTRHSLLEKYVTKEKNLNCAVAILINKII